MADRFPMTPAGQRKLRDELKRLREVDRPKNVLDIETARAHGDISENAEYSAFSEMSPWARAVSMSSTFLGRSTSRRRLSSSRSFFCPAGVMGKRSARLVFL